MKLSAYYHTNINQMQKYPWKKLQMFWTWCYRIQKGPLFRQEQHSLSLKQNYPILQFIP